MQTNLLSKCSVCGNQDLNYLKGYEKLFLLKCKKCDFVFDERVASPQELNDYYDAANLAVKVIPEATINSFNKLLDYFEKYKGAGNILDLSCGQGDFLVEAQKRNWNVYGTEFSHSAIKFCQDRGITMHQDDLNKEIFGDIKFDVITSFEVIEHINNPNDFVSVINHKLQDKGVAYCTTPNFNSLLRFFEKDRFKMIVYPVHISFYTKQSIKYLGKLNNLKSIKLKTTGLDLGRLIEVFKPSRKENSFNLNKHFHANKEITEKVRMGADSSILLKFIKNIINFILSIFGAGDTLKVFWKKNNLND